MPIPSNYKDRSPLPVRMGVEALAATLSALTVGKEISLHYEKFAN
jgi:hypothetical protein